MKGGMDKSKIIGLGILTSLVEEMLEQDNLITLLFALTTIQHYKQQQKTHLLSAYITLTNMDLLWNIKQGSINWNKA